MTYDPEELNDQAEEIASGDFDQHAEIVSVETAVAEDIFGDETMSDPTKEMIVVDAETEGETEIQSVFSSPQGPLSWRNPQFKLGQFREKYDDVPREGMTVEVTVDENGFLTIDY